MVSRPLRKTSNGHLTKASNGSLTTMLYCCEDDKSTLEAVAERQKARGETPIDTTKCHTLCSLRKIINDIAPDFLADNTWAGGSEPPNTLSSSYADDATDCGELLTKVKKMQKTYATYEKQNEKYWVGSSTTSWQDAEDGWMSDTGRAEGHGHYALLDDATDTYDGYQLYGVEFDFVDTPLTTDISRKTELYLSTITPKDGNGNGTYDQQGDSFAPTTPQEYQYVDDSGYTTSNWTKYIDASDPPPNRPSSYKALGWRFADIDETYDRMQVAITTWDFAYT